MNTLSTLIEPLGWALLHFLWQGAVIGLLLRGFLQMTRRRSPQVRYAAAGAAMLLMLGAAVGTVVGQWPAVRVDIVGVVDGKNETDGKNGKYVAAAPYAASLPENPSYSSPPSHTSQRPPPETLPLPAAPSPPPTTADRLRPLLPWMVGAWAAGVLFFSLRLLNGWRVVRRWRSSAESTIPGDWAHRFSRLCERLGITRSVRLLSSATLAVPVVIGWLKPAVLVPASLFTGLTAAQLEALLAHELAHVRRHDYLVNLLQSALETLFFYHPAVWWVSGQLRNEREHCCDDAATVLAGGVLDYARALAALEEMRAMPAALGVSAAGGSLLQRIRRLAGVSEQSAAGLAWPLGLLTLAAAAVALPFTLLQAAPQDSPVPADESEPQRIAAPKSKHEQTADLLRLRRGEYKDASAVPAEAMKRLAAQVAEYIEKYPGESAEKMKSLLPELEKDQPWAWEKALTAIDSLCDVATAPVGWLELKEQFRAFDRVKPGAAMTAEEVSKLPFGPAAKNGLRAAWVFDPMKGTYAAGDVLKCRIILHNSGNEPIEFRTDQWHQMEQLRVHDAAGKEVEVKSSWFTGIAPWFRFKLEPGQVCKVGSHGLIIGKPPGGDESYGVEIPARPGDELTCHRGVNIEWGTGSKDGSGGDGIPHYLTTGDVKFKVTAPNPKAVSKVGAAFLQFRLVAGREEPDTEPVEPVENWSDLPTFHLRKTVILTAADVKSATAELDKDSGRWQIKLVFSEEGAAALAKATKENIGRQLAIVGNGKVISAPVIQGEMSKEVILSGNYLESEAKELVEAIQAAASPRGAAIEPAVDRKAGELVIDVAADGSLTLDGESLTLEALKTKLTEIATQDKKRAVIIRGDTRTGYDKIISILNVTHEAGLHQVSFATKTTAEGDRKSAAEKLLEESAAKGDGKQQESLPRIMQHKAPGGLDADGADKPAEPAAPHVPAGPKSGIHQHKDGTRTESVRKDNTLRESTYNKQGDLVSVRVFTLNKQAQVRHGVIYDGRMNPLGRIEFGYDPKTGEPSEERHYNNKAQLTRRLFYPGALKEQEYAGGFVAFSYDPENPKAKPVVEAGAVKPTLPVSDGKEAPPPGEPKAGAQAAHSWLKSFNPGRISIDRKNGEIRESRYDRNDRLVSVNVAYLDGQGRHRQAVGYDGKMNPTASIIYSYDATTGQLSVEKHFDTNGKLVRKTLGDEITKRDWRNGFIGEVMPFSFGRPVVNTGEEGDAPKVDVVAEAQRLTALAQGFYDAGQFEKARETFEAALILDPANAAVRGKWLLSEAMLVRQSNPFAVPTHPVVLLEARKTSLSLTVKDSDGRKTIPEFRVIAGVRSGVGGGKDVVNWQPHTLRVGTNGGMMWPLDKAYDEMALRVEADGCAPQVFNWIDKKKGPQDLYFQLVEDKGIFCQVLTPDGQPASGATVAIGMVQRDAVIEGGRLRHDGEALPDKESDRWRRPRLIQVYAGGGFWLPAENDPTAAVLVVHHTGVREMSLAEFRKLEDGKPRSDGAKIVLHLQPWARIEGKVQWGDKPGANQKVSLTIHRDTYGYPGIIAQYEKTTSGADGSFVFEKVLPGRVQLSCPIAADAGNKSGITEINMTGQIAHVEVKPGTNEAVIGGSGRTVKGKLTGRDSWEGVTFHFHPTAPHIGFSGDDEMWKTFGEFKKSPSGPLFFREGLKVNADGTFEITGVLPGSYQIFFITPPPKEPAPGIPFEPPTDKKVPQAHVLRDFASGKFSVPVEVPGQKPGILDAGEFAAGK